MKPSKYICHNIKTDEYVSKVKPIGGLFAIYTSDQQHSITMTRNKWYKILKVINKKGEWELKEYEKNNC